MISEHCAAVAAAVGAVVPYSQTVIEPTQTPVTRRACSCTRNGSCRTGCYVPGFRDGQHPCCGPGCPAAPVTTSPARAAPNTPPVERCGTDCDGQLRLQRLSCPACPWKLRRRLRLRPPPQPPSSPDGDSSSLTSTVHPSSETARQPRLQPAPFDDGQPVTGRRPARTPPRPPPTAQPSPRDGQPGRQPKPHRHRLRPPTQPQRLSAHPEAAATTPPATHKTGSLALLISFVILVVVLGTMAPLIGRWRKRKMLERTGSPNLSFTNDLNPNEVSANEANSDQGKPEPRKVA